MLRDSENNRTPSKEPCRFKRWPNIPIRVIASADDRFFPLGFQRRVARDCLDMEVQVVSGGHLVALSNPAELVEELLRYG
jgi:pimeloyl-ACP methyl ester carboxylesterase